MNQNKLDYSESLTSCYDHNIPIVVIEYLVS